MEALAIVRLVGFYIILPQAAGVLVSLPARYRPLRFLRFVAPLAAAVLFWVITDWVWAAAADRLRQEGKYVCGMFGLMYALSLCGGALVHVMLGTAVQAVLWAVARAHRKGKPEAA